MSSLCGRTQYNRQCKPKTIEYVVSKISSLVMDAYKADRHTDVPLSVCIIKWVQVLDAVNELINAGRLTTADVPFYLDYLVNDFSPGENLLDKIEHCAWAHDLHYRGSGNRGAHLCNQDKFVFDKVCQLLCV